MNYSARVIENVPTKPGCWNYQKIGVFDGDTQIGEYIRNYSSFMRTFFPFEYKGEWYALYSKDYTSTRVMRLPSCEDWCGEERNQWGFCPVDYHVPQIYIDADFKKKGFAPFGFVAGCVWGDDSSWKIQFLDLSRLEEKILKRDDRFGYIELADEKLSDAIDASVYDIEEGGYIEIACRKLCQVGELDGQKQKEEKTSNTL